jgi:hypothetical protein
MIATLGDRRPGIAGRNRFALREPAELSGHRPLVEDVRPIIRVEEDAVLLYVRMGYAEEDARRLARTHYPELFDRLEGARPACGESLLM